MIHLIMKALLMLVLVGLLGVGSADAAYDVYMRFLDGPDSGVGKGDSQDETFSGNDGWFGVLSTEFSIENTVDIGSTSGGAGRASFGVVGLSKRTNAISAELFKRAATGQHFNGAEIVFVRSSGAAQGGQVFMKFEMLLVMVQKVELTGSDGNDIVQESVELQHGAQRVSFWTQKKDGSMDPNPTVAIWSRVKNNATFSVN